MKCDDDAGRRTHGACDRSPELGRAYLGHVCCRGSRTRTGAWPVLIIERPGRKHGHVGVLAHARHAAMAAACIHGHRYTRTL